MLRPNRHYGRVVSVIATLACVACSNPSAPSRRPAAPITGEAGAGAGVGALAVPDPVFKTTPPANALDQINGYFPLTVTFNLCRSTDPDPGDQLRYTFDFDNDGNVDFRGTCRASHTYHASSTARVCVSDRNPDGEVCKTYAIAPAPPKVESTPVPEGAPEFASAPAAGATITLSVAFGSTSTASLNVTNSGEASLTAAPSGLSGVLSISPSTQQSIAAGATQAFTISCSPVAATTTTQTLTLTTNDADEGTNTYTVQCTGTNPWPPAGCYYSSVYSLYIIWQGNQTQGPSNDMTWEVPCGAATTGVGGFWFVSTANASDATSLCSGLGSNFIGEVSSSAATGAWPIYRCQIP